MLGNNNNPFSSNPVQKNTPGGYNPFGGGQQSTGLTNSQRELVPYIMEQKQEEKEKGGLLKPVAFIFDLLSRGQYMVANMAEELFVNKDDNTDILGEIGRIGKAGWQGITGEKKGSFQDILATTSLNKPYIQTKEGEDIPVLSALSNPSKVLGFALDVLLDPLNYVSFGASSAAKAAAKSYADDTMKLFMKNADNFVAVDDSLRKIFDSDTFQKVMQKSPTRGAKMIAANNNTEAARFMERLYKQSYKEAIHMSEDEARDKIAGQLMRMQDKSQRESVQELVTSFLEKEGAGIATSTARAGRSGVDDVAKLFDSNKRLGYVQDVNAVLNGTKAIDDLPKRLQTLLKEKGLDSFKQAQGTDDFLKQAGSSYANMGESAVKVFGVELGRKVRGTGKIAKQMETIREGLHNTKLGKKMDSFSAAWYNKMNSGVIGAFRQKMGFRNPYQTLLRAKEMDMKKGFEYGVKTQSTLVRQLTKDIDDDIMRKYVKARSSWAAPGQLNPGDPDLLQKAIANVADNPEEAARLMEVHTIISKYYDDLAAEESQWAAKGLINEIEEKQNYFNLVWRDRKNKTPKVYRAQTKGLKAAAEEESKIWQHLYGIDDNMAREIVENNQSGVVTKLDELMLHRGISHERMRKRAGFIEQFREYGLHVEEVNQLAPEYAQAFKSPAWYEKLGLRTIDDEAFQGYLFDNDVAEVIERTMFLGRGEPELKRATAIIQQYTQFWKTIATSTPGFHMRNLYSNNVTGYFKHGIRWLDHGATRDSNIAAVLALQGENAGRPILKAMGLDDAKIQTWKQSTSYGPNLTNGELVEYAKRKGVISEMSHGYDNFDVVEKALNGESKSFNPMKKDFIGYKASQNVGALFESSSRMKSFLLDVKGVGRGGDITESMLEYGKLEAKKWFLDYDDLTKFEKSYLKPIMPFYTWTRKNIANQISMLMDPGSWGMVSSFAKVKNLLQDDAFDESNLPEYMKEGGYFGIGKMGDGEAMFFPNIPLMDLNRLPFSFKDDGTLYTKDAGMNAIKEIISMANPVLKSLGELAFDYDSFRERPMSEEEIGSKYLGVITKVPLATAFLDGIAKIFNKDGLGIRKNSKDQVMISGWANRLIENNLPMLKQFEKYVSLGESMGDALGVDIRGLINKAVGAVGKNEDEGTLEEKMQSFFKTMSFYLGIKPDYFDDKEAGYWKANEIYENALNERYKDRRVTGEGTRRMNAAQVRDYRTYRKLGLL